eukprot:CAMPEP_0181317626 /NCGR_PEP_ID=MMETSP1101-20121128/16571_1 /TAXON_ID=46948 /ORGANISM="Rhodomonas abbreviata, Strain Caron Lab Isolate" /LENGTH=634 /DNA_ID=CAMNT_0023425037 /DNA_START=13 /DNA_END=1917 /DNA_ORIENTATION=+
MEWEGEHDERRSSGTASTGRNRRYIFLAAVAACACAAVLVASTTSNNLGDTDDFALWRARGEAVELSMRMRGHDLTAPVAAAKASKAVAGKQTTASPHATKPAAPPKPVLSPEQIAKAKQEQEIWNSEQAMKKQLDDSVDKKGSTLWKQTVDVVHKNDPNAKLIHSLEPELSSKHGPHHAQSSKVVRHSDESWKERMKAELNSKVSTSMNHEWKTEESKEEAGFSKASKGSKAAETAQAHAAMPLKDMKHMLKSQLDTSVKSVVARAKQLEGFNSDKQLQKRLRAELDSKTKLQQKKMLELAKVKSHLKHDRSNLSGKVSRAQMVRAQLTKEMKEENAIRSQLDHAAKRQGQAMLHNEVTDQSKAATPHQLTRKELEKQLRARLSMHEKQQQQGGGGTGDKGKDKVLSAKKSLLHKALGGEKKLKPGEDLSAYLRHELNSADKTKQHALYKHSLQGNLLKRVEKMVVNKDQDVQSKNKAIQKAEMRLFTQSMHGAEQRAAQQSAQHQSSSDDDAILTKEKALLHKAMTLTHAPPKHTSSPAQQTEARVLSTEKKVMARTEKAAASQKEERPFATLHDEAANGVVHDMAHANARLSHSLGHTKALEEAKETEEEIKSARKRMIQDAQHDEDEAVE